MSKFTKGEVVFWPEMDEYVVVSGTAWDDDTELVKVWLTRCGETETARPSKLRRLSKRERGELKSQQK